MNNLKRFFALMLCIAMVVVCFAGCHEKGEVAVKIGDIEFSSGYYACALVFADMDARYLVEQNLPEEALSGEIEYWEYKVEEMDYEEWVRKTALDTLKTHAALMTLCKENKVELKGDELATAESSAGILWDGSEYSIAYSTLMEPNGVAKDTFVSYMTYENLKEEYFNFLYGKGGKEEIKADKLSKQLTDNYVLANKLEVSFSGLKDEEKTEKKNQLAGYEASLKDKSKTFEDIYLAYNNQKAEDHKHEEPKEGEKAPKDPHASILSSDDTNFETAKKMAVGEIKLITLKDDAGLVLLVKQDISADPYYIETFDNMLRQEIVDDKLDKKIEEHAKKLTCEVNDFSIEQFDIEDIAYPEA